MYEYLYHPKESTYRQAFLESDELWTDVHDTIESMLADIDCVDGNEEEIMRVVRETTHDIVRMAMSWGVA